MSFRDDVLAGLAARPRAIPARWFYDRRGSELFEAITALPEYYPTRTETAILERIAPELAQAVPRGAAVVEFGSGSSTKTPLVLRAVAASLYAPIDISGASLAEAVAALRRVLPDLPIAPVEADFTRSFALPPAVDYAPKLGFFPGSTIGNLAPFAACDLLRSMRAVLGDGALLMIGMDRIKDVGVLLRAYDDAAGVTAAFNRNLLVRINRELDGSVPVDAFQHVARWNARDSRIEMHLVATRDVAFTVAGQPFALASGETIHTENSHKYGERDARMLLATGGWTALSRWTDPDELFDVYLAAAASPAAAP